ncbi:MAG: sulfite exporter TauE/SafE family protein [Planctomycetes bacterium]|nr:sulfite exporter TauE/SafE family protein [Planctomycetota bacterium]
MQKPVKLAAPSSGGRLAPAQRLGAFAAAYRGPLKALVLGTLNGLLSCPLVYAFLAKAAASGALAIAFYTMAALGLGTIPALLAVAATGIPSRRSSASAW